MTWDPIRARRGPGAAILALVLGAAGCTYGFPKVDQSHRFACQKPSDCVDGYVCGADRKCDLPSEADGGGADGGSPDGGTSDGGVGPCDSRLAVEPAVIDGDIGTKLRLYVPAAQTRPTPEVTVGGRPTGAVASLPVSPDSISYGFSANVPPGLAAGSALVRVDFGGGTCFAGAVRVVTLPTNPKPAANVTVPAGAAVQGSRVDVVVSGLAQAIAPGDPVTVWLVASGREPVEMDAVRVVDGQTLRATVPESMGGGPYGVVVVTQDRVSASADGALDVALAPGPSLTAASPVHLPQIATNAGPPTYKAVSIEIQGTDILAKGQVWLTCGFGKAVTSGTPTTLTQNGPMETVSVPMPDVTGPVPCVLSYQAPASDGGVTVTLPGLEAFVDNGMPPALHTWTTGPASLSVPRKDPGAAVATLADGSRYLVVAGGADGSGDALASTDVVRLGDDGSPKATVPGSLLTAGVIGPAMAAVGPVVYLAGGTTTSGESQSVLRAQVLGPGDRVSGLDAYLDLDGTGYDGGANGVTLYYAVTALYQVGDGTGPLDETPATAVLRVDVPPGIRADVILTWQVPTEAPTIGYRVYRSTSPAAVEALPLGTGGSKTLNEYHDDGSAQTTVKAYPPKVGDLSAWQDLSSKSTLVSPITGAALAYVAPDSQGTTGPLLVAAGGQQTQATTTSHLDLIQDATLGDVIPAATVDAFAAATASTGGSHPVLSLGRSDLDARVLESDWSPDAVTDKLRPTVLFGPGAASAVNTTGGDIWSVGDGAASGMDSLPMSFSDGHLFVGAATVDLVGHQASNGTLVEDLGTLSFSGTGSTSKVSVAGWSTLTAAHLPYATQGTASAQAGAFCYVAGGVGTTDGVKVAWTIR